MKRKQVMGFKKRRFMIIARRLLTAAAAAILVILTCNSSITVESNGLTYRQSIGPFDKRGSFESSKLFEDILREQVHGITRMAVISSQLETDGTYNGQKQIDIAQFAHRQENLPETGPSSSYFLDDLIKWGNYGFVTERVYATEGELNSYFAQGSSAFSMQDELTAGDWRTQSKTSGTLLKRLLDERDGETLSMRMISELPSSREDYHRMAEELGKTVTDSQIIGLDILVPRYLSADGLDLAEYASNVKEYIQLREDLKTTSQELFYNFTEYSGNLNKYHPDETNIRYCYRMAVDGEVLYFSNLEGSFENKKLEEITAQFQSYGPYVFYNADRAQIETDTGLGAEVMKQELAYYQYAFGDNTRVWLAVDSSYPAADGFWQAREAYRRLMPYYGYMVGAFVFLTALSLLLLIWLTRYEGRREKEEGGYIIVLYRADRMLTEPFFLLGSAIFAAFIWAGFAGTSFCISTWEDVKNSPWLPASVGAFVILADYAAVFFYLSLVRRAKAHTLWSNSLFRLLMIKTKQCMLSLYDNSHILVRSLVPFIGILLLNLVLGDLGVAGILTAAAADTAAILLLYQEKKALSEIVERTKRIGQGDFDLKIDARRMHGENGQLAAAVNSIGDGIKTAVEKSMKDERLKADLITNVSHDIKTPLTSIINFVNLLKREKIEDERIQGYINVLDAKSQRLKQLTDDLVEASKITSGNISLQMEKINFAELVNQTCGEFTDKFRERCLDMIVNMPEGPVYIEADSRRIWRVVENLFGNACKYALEGTRVYLDMTESSIDGKRYAVFSMKNISAQALNIQAEELTERFIRGDISRSTEGSGLGLSIAKNLTELQKGRFEIYLDGDLFKVLLTFPCVEDEA